MLAPASGVMEHKSGPFLFDMVASNHAPQAPVILAPPVRVHQDPGSKARSLELGESFRKAQLASCGI